MKPKLKRGLIITGIGIVSLVAVVILFISPITKYLVEKHDKEFTGREIEMDWAYVNPFTGYVYFSGLKVHESESDSTFFSTEGLGVNFSVYKMLGATYEITNLTLDGPRAIIIQSKTHFNFDDLIKKFTPENPDTTKAPTHFSIADIRVIDGEFHYRESSIPVNYFVKQVNIESSGMSWDVDTVPIKFSLVSGPGTGSIEGNSTINVRNNDYRFAITVSKFDLKLLEQYLNDLSKYGSLSAYLDADMRGTGNFDDTEAITSSGMLAISDFHFGKNPNEDYASFDKLTMSIAELSPKRHIYSYDSLSLVHPYFKYERYDTLDNLQNMFGEKGSNIEAAKADGGKFNLILEIADYMKILARNFFKSDYKIDRVAVYDANILFNDYSISEKFEFALAPLNFMADSIDRTKDRVGMALTSGTKPYGKISVNVSINPKDSSDFTMKYQFGKFPSSMFNPYIISYTSFSLDRGTLELKGNWNVKNGIIHSNNNLLIIDPRTTKKIRNKDTKWIPMPLIMSFVRERGNVIDYQIPIKGNLNDPSFKLRDVIFDLLKNIFIKPPTTPYGIQVKNVETEIEKSLSLKWDMRQNALLNAQEKLVERMVEFLEDNPEATIDIYPKHYAAKEKEHILLFEAKKKYYLLQNGRKASSFDENDSLKVNKMSAKDPAFIRFLDKQLADSMLFTIQEKCSKWIGREIVKVKFEKLMAERKENFIIFFKEKNVDGRARIHSSENVIPYNGFSFFKIDYKGAFPKSLLDAYRKMNELDEEAPRKKYKRERRSGKGAV